MRRSSSRATILLAIQALFFFCSCASAPDTGIAKEWYELGNTWFDKGDWKKAGEAYSKAIALDPSLAAATFNLARALTEGGDYDAALRALDSLRQADPQNTRVQAVLAWVYYKKGDSALAIAAYDEVLLLDPYAPDAVYNSAFLRYAAGDNEKALADLERYLAYKPDDEQALLLSARIQDKLGKTEPAMVIFERLAAKGKLSATDSTRLGALYEARHRYSEALAAYAQAIKVQPKFAPALFATARLKLTIAEDGPGGLEALNSALEAGFKDAKAAQELIDTPTVASREEVMKLLGNKGLVH